MLHHDDPCPDSKPFCSFLALHLIAAATNAVEFRVENTADSGDQSLRWAILEVNNVNNLPGPHTITFNIPVAVPAVITPLSALPAITQTVEIQGQSQAGFAGTPIIVLDGTLAGAGANGLTINASDCVVRSLAIINFREQRNRDQRRQRQQTRRQLHWWLPNG